MLTQVVINVVSLCPKLTNMKKIINLFALPLLAGIVIVTALHTFIPVQHMQNIDMLGNDTDIAFGLLGFLFGFLPCFIWAMASNTLAALRPVCEPVSIQENDQAPAIYVGQTIAQVGTNCVLRVKALKVRAILEYNNPELANYI